MMLRVMTFNIRFGTAPDGENHWDHRKGLVAEAVAGAAPDVAGLQEATGPQLDELAAMLPGYGVVRGAAYARISHTALLVRTERLEVVDEGSFRLGPTPDWTGPAWDAAVTRAATWTVLAPGEPGGRFAILNTHFDHVGRRARTASAFLVVDWLRERAGLPQIVVGDLNARERSDPMRVLRAAGLRDAWRTAHPWERRDATYHAFRGRTFGPRIDHILVDASWTVEGAEILRAARDGRYPSDHYPVTADLRLGAGSRSV